ncbi:DNA methyltransferase [Veillonella caviae]|uniref:DNA methyltransferase n=1 Tax=Veillonella caviae TaxID=248316 RepID=UPI0023F2E897|nr:DNA methyltransferase [Veillonella caviae]MCI6408046.1 methylase [Veillonella caviae]MDY6224569.1 DNA methyltransferase [Veillonella caviae]
MLTAKQQEKAAKDFVSRWLGKGDEKQDSQRFWIDLLQNVYGIDRPTEFISFEYRVQLNNVSYIDAIIPATHVMIEQKSLGRHLDKPIKQSDGQLLTPFEQAKRYAASLPYSERPRWIVSCNFSEFLVFDMERPNDAPESVLLENLEKEYYRLQFLVDVKDSRIQKELEISKSAGELIGRIYEQLYEQYKLNPQLSDDVIHQHINKLCVRLVFCLYAEDAGLFGSKNMFHDYLNNFKPEQTRKALLELFRILDTPTSERSPYEEKALLDFPYVNGSLFTDEIEIPPFKEETLQVLLDDGCQFDWSEISPTIFGGIFESTLNPATRRSGGMHYTSIENIHKVIDPLFLNDLHNRFQSIMSLSSLPKKERNKRLRELQNYIASLTFLDPAAGSGNFLTESYLSLRRLENDILREITRGLGIDLGFAEEEYNPIRVSINQFYGIEINDFAVAVARTALWIAEAQMLKETQHIIDRELEYFPLHTFVNIHEANALQIDWRTVVEPTKLNYIMGNPPFLGARIMNEEQKADVEAIFTRKWKNWGNLDYVCCWFKKVSDYITNTECHCALVSTNSVSQGSSVADLWGPLLEDGLIINFAYRPFIWNSESADKAHVHCVIIGFSKNGVRSHRFIDDNGKINIVNHINPYLFDGSDILVSSRSKPYCDIPQIGIGNKLIDNGNYLFTYDEYIDFINTEPNAKSFFKRIYGSREFINNIERYCLWLGNVKPNEIRSMPLVQARVEAVRNFRLTSKSQGTRVLAEYPTHFHVENLPHTTYIVIPKTSSENRRYIPIGFFTPEVMVTDALFIVDNANLYHFGILTSNVHMAWMRTVAGRLKSDYRYSKDIVYNNFPWPKSTEQQKSKIEKTAQAILDARALYPDSSLADLYDSVAMPAELRKAHRANDRAVMEAYGFSTNMTEEDCVAELMKLYAQLVDKENSK